MALLGIHMATSIQITLWFRQNEKQEWVYNHYFVGQPTSPKHPEPLHESHVKTWKSGKWAYSYANLIDSTVCDKRDMIRCV